MHQRLKARMKNIFCYKIYKFAGAFVAASSLNNYKLSWFFSSLHSKTPRSVMTPVMNFAGVTSNAGFQTLIPGAAILLPEMYVISCSGRSSITIESPEARDASMLVKGAQT